MKTILVPTDFSKCAYVAAHFAVELAHITKAKIILINTFSIPIPPPDSLVTPIAFAELKEESLKRLKKMADFELRANKNFADLEIQYEAILGDSADEIVDAAKKHGAELIVMGTHGASGILSTILGTNTASVIKKASCPVLAIPEIAKFQGFKNLTVAVDLSEIYSNASVKWLLEFTSIFNSKIELLHVISKPEQKEIAENEMKRIVLIKIFEHTPHSFHIVLNKNVSQAIDYFADENNSDALVTIPHKHTFLEFLFNKSISRELAFHIKKPLLCLPFQSDQT